MAGCCTSARCRHDTLPRNEQYAYSAYVFKWVILGLSLWRTLEGLGCTRYNHTEDYLTSDTKRKNQQNGEEEGVCREN